MVFYLYFLFLLYLYLIFLWIFTVQLKNILKVPQTWDDTVIEFKMQLMLRYAVTSLRVWELVNYKPSWKKLCDTPKNLQKATDLKFDPSQGRLGSFQHLFFFFPFFFSFFTFAKNCICKLSLYIEKHLNVHQTSATDLLAFTGEAYYTAYSVFVQVSWPC